MPKSMTGYGISEKADECRKITVEIKSVNNRYADVNIKLRGPYVFMEEHIRNAVLNRISRGKIDVFVTVWQYKNDSVEVNADEALAQQYYNALLKISEATGVPCNVTAERISSYSDVLVVTQKEQDKEEIKEEIMSVVHSALDDFVAAREREGERISKTLMECIDGIEEIRSKIEERMPNITEEYRNRLFDRISEVLHDANIDEQRLITEAAIFADKVCTDEENVRLKSHIAEFKNIMAQEIPVGRKLDFLIQEMNREVNTIGSKASDTLVARLVVDAKSEIEKLREQVQNIE